jgi:hypothetical protein
MKISGIVLFVTSHQYSTEREPVVSVRRFLADLAGRMSSSRIVEVEVQGNGQGNLSWQLIGYLLPNYWS